MKNELDLMIEADVRAAAYMMSVGTWLKKPVHGCMWTAHLGFGREQPKPTAT